MALKRWLKEGRNNNNPFAFSERCFDRWSANEQFIWSINRRLVCAWPCRKVALEFACLHGSITRVNTGTMAILGPRQTAPLRQSHRKAQGTATRLAQNSCTLCDTLIITWHSVLRCTFSSVLAFKCSRALFERKQRDKLVNSEPNQEKLGEKQTVTARLTAFNWLTLAVCPGNTILIGAR